MDSPPDAEQGHQRTLQFSRGIHSTIPVEQSAFHVTFHEWDRLKDRIRSITSRENLWIAATFFSFSAAISFCIAAVTLTQVENVPQPVLIAFFCIASAGLVGAVVCVCGCWESRSGRKKGIDAAIEHMADIERLYRSEEGKG